MPYMTSKSVPACTTSSEAKRSINHYEREIDAISRNHHCSCLEPCESIIYSTTEEVRDTHNRKSDTTVLLQMVDEFSESELYSYDIVSLVTDCAEAFELINGLSALLLFYSIPYLFSQTSFNIKKKTSYPSSLNELVTRLFHAEMQIPDEETKPKTWKYYFPVAFCSFALFCCAVTAISLIAYRVCFYDSHTTHLTQHWHHNPNRTLPHLILCGEGKQVGNLRRVLARQYNRSDCDFSIWDMFALSNVGIEELWQMTDIRGFLIDVKEDLIQPISSPYGQCFEVPIDVMSEEVIIKLDPKTEFTSCLDSGLKVFITTDEEIDTKIWLTPRGELPVPGSSEIKLRDITIVLDHENCGQIKNATCEILCWEAILNKSIKCRLPYMPHTSTHIEVCNSSQAVETHILYMKLLAEFDPFATYCDCIRPCTQKVVLFDEQSQYDNRTESVATLKFRFSSSISQQQSRVDQDNFFKTTKDCFRLIKLFLGLSLVGIAYAILTASGCVISIMFVKHKNSNKTFPVKKFPEPETVLPIK